MALVSDIPVRTLDALHLMIAKEISTVVPDYDPRGKSPGIKVVQF